MDPPKMLGLTSYLVCTVSNGFISIALLHNDISGIMSYTYPGCAIPDFPNLGLGMDAEKTSGKQSSKLLSKCLFFSLNKSSKQNPETTPARPQLYFAPKIIEIRLTVLENELIEVCMLIIKN